METSFRSKTGLTRTLMFSLLASPTGPASALGPWTAAPDPVITRDFPEGYGDPEVIKTGSGYLMYLTKRHSTAQNRDGVAVVSARSPDGRTWKIDRRIALAPSTSPAKWDGRKVETPSLVYFNNRWHLYYCGLGGNGRYQIGHATSTDLARWGKSRANPVLRTRSVGDGSRVLHVCEPGAVVFNGRIYLFFVVAKARPGLGAYPPGQHSIYLAISKTSKGDSFTKPVEVLTQGRRYRAKQGYTGYSTVDVHADGDTLHLFHDVFRYNGNPNDPWGGYYQVALGHAESTDGMNWTEDPEPIFTRSRFTWTSREIRSPSVIRDDGQWKMWFAGDNIAYDPRKLGFTGQFSIGYATAPP